MHPTLVQASKAGAVVRKHVRDDQLLQGWVVVRVKHVLEGQGADEMSQHGQSCRLPQRLLSQIQHLQLVQPQPSRWGSKDCLYARPSIILNHLLHHTEGRRLVGGVLAGR